MQVTSTMTANNAIYNFQNLQTSLNNLSEQLATGKNVNQPSDDPLAMSTLLNTTDSINSLNQYATNITEGTTALTTTGNALTGIASIMSQAKTLADSIYSGTSDTTGVVEQLTSLKQQIVDYANTQSGDSYALGGAETSSVPFSQSSNAYSGNSSQSNIEIAPGVTQNVSVDGGSVLLGTGSYGTTNILNTFDNLITAVQNDNVTSIQTETTALEAGADQVNNAQADVSARLTMLNNMSSVNTNNLNTLQNTISNIQTVNTATVGVELQQEETSYSAALAATSKISQLSLLNYM